MEKDFSKSHDFLKIILDINIFIDIRLITIGYSYILKTQLDPYISPYTKLSQKCI